MLLPCWCGISRSTPCAFQCLHLLAMPSSNILFLLPVMNGLFFYLTNRQLLQSRHLFAALWFKGLFSATCRRLASRTCGLSSIKLNWGYMRDFGVVGAGNASGRRISWRLLSPFLFFGLNILWLPLLLVLLLHSFLFLFFPSLFLSLPDPLFFFFLLSLFLLSFTNCFLLFLLLDLVLYYAYLLVELTQCQWQLSVGFVYQVGKVKFCSVVKLPEEQHSQKILRKVL